MSKPIIYIVNKSTIVTDDEVAIMTKACNTQLVKHVAPALFRLAWVVKTASPTFAVPVGSCQIVIMDDPDQAGALGYHTEEEGGIIWGRVFVKPVLEHGGTKLSGNLSVASVLSHEVIETFMDRNVNLWADMMDGREVAVEACDPVEGDSYDITVTYKKSDHAVSVSNFVTDKWFDSLAAPNSGGFDYMGIVLKPMTMSSGGYMVVYDPATQKVEEVFGSTEAQTRHRAIKPKFFAARSARRV